MIRGMRKIKVYLCEKGGDVLPFLYLSDVMGYYGITGIYNIRDRGDDFEYRGIRVRRFDLAVKRGSNKKY